MGPVGEKAGDIEGQFDGVGSRLMQSLGTKTSRDNNPLGRVEEWAEEANKAQAERQAKEREQVRPGSPGSDTAIDEKGPARTSNELRPSTTFDSDAPSKTVSHPSATHSDAMNIGTKRRRRATTRSSRREFHASDDIISQADAEELMQMVQGHLVLWPYDWLAKEEQGGNWLYSIDGLAPLEI